MRQRFKREELDRLFTEIAEVDSRLEGIEVFGRTELLAAAEEIGARDAFIDFRPPRGRIRTFRPAGRERAEFLSYDDVVDAARQAGFSEGAIEIVMRRTGDNDPG